MTSLDLNEIEQGIINEKVLSLLKENGDGVSPGDIVHKVSEDSEISKRLIREALQILLEKGDLSLGPKLRIFISQP